MTTSTVPPETAVEQTRRWNDVEMIALDLMLDDRVFSPTPDARRRERAFLRGDRVQRAAADAYERALAMTRQAVAS